MTIIKSIIKWALQVCFSALIKEISFEIQTRKEEIVYEAEENSEQK